MTKKNNMKVIPFWGCMMPLKYPQMELAIRKTLPNLGIELVDIEGFTCCPDPIYFKARDKVKWLTIAARNLAVAEEAGRVVTQQPKWAPPVTPEQIHIDIPSSPSVPYSQAAKTRPNIINSFRREPDGRKTPVNLEEFSPFFKQFKGHLRIIRVYTPRNFRNQVKAACDTIFPPPGNR